MNHFIKTTLFLSLIFLFASCKKDKSETDSTLNVETFSPEIIELPAVLTESSGAYYDNAIGEHLWTFNDGGNPTDLYKINISNGSLEQTKTLRDGTNKDWEAIATNENSFYIGDFGNNAGDRTNLLIYIISKNDLAASDTVDFEIIPFAYENQTDFTPSNDHNFDCEAMIHLDDKLFLFTKNRGNNQTHVYTLLDVPGAQIARLYDTLHVDGLITDATINSEKSMIALLGYTRDDGQYNPFIWLLYDYPDMDFLNGKRKRIELPIKEQTEGLTFKDSETLYFTCEEEMGEDAFLWSFDVGKWR